MTETTPLDAAYSEMVGNPEDDTARLRYFGRLAETELFVLLKAEAKGDQIEPRIFETDGQSFVLSFDREDRLTAFAEGPAPYVAMSGRLVARLLAENGLCLALNPSTAPSEILLPNEVMLWLTETLSLPQNVVEERPVNARPPSGLPPVFVESLGGKLALAQGFADRAVLVRAEYDSGRCDHLLAIIDAIPESQESLVRAVNEALVFSGIEAGAVDVGFLRSTDALVPRLEKVGLRFDLPAPEISVNQPSAPGTDPTKPPILR